MRKILIFTVLALLSMVGSKVLILPTYQTP